jgi:hypothetical protein
MKRRRRFEPERFVSFGALGVDRPMVRDAEAAGVADAAVAVVVVVVVAVAAAAAGGDVVAVAAVAFGETAPTDTEADYRDSLTKAEIALTSIKDPTVLTQAAIAQTVETETANIAIA